MSERTQWHPLLAQFLKHDYGDKLYIRDAVPLGKMPLEMDLLIEPLAPIDSLPYPFNHIGWENNNWRVQKSGGYR